MAKAIFAILFLLISTPSFAVMVGGPPKQLHPRPQGLAGCACFWDIRFDLDKKSARFAHDLLKALEPASMNSKLFPSGVYVFRREKDLCQRNRSTLFDRERTAQNEQTLLGVLAELVKE